MFDSFKEAIRTRVRPTSMHLASLHGDLRNRLRCFRSHRTSAEQTELAQDFIQVLRAWGIEDAAQLPFVLRELRLRLLVFVLPVTVCVLATLITKRVSVWLAVALIASPCLLGIVTTLWRISVLKAQRFQPFTSWLCSVVGLAQKRP